jgi:hypothetical protein
MARSVFEVTSRIVTLRNSQGHALHCMLEEPFGGARGARYAAVLLCPGVKTRLGPHRLYRKLAQSFLARGIPVLRVDFHGLGDSEGSLPEYRLDELYDQVQYGRHVDDLRAALDWLDSQCGIRRCIVGGLCGGAITGLLAAQNDPRISGLYAIGLPVALEAKTEARVEHMTRNELLAERVSYLRKFFRPSSWKRLLMMQSNYRLIWRMLKSALLGFAAARTGNTQFGDAPAPATPVAADLNPKFPSAFFRLVDSGRPALLMFGERDRLRFQYQEKFGTPWSQALEPYKGVISIVVVPNANHILGDPASVADAARLTGSWLDAHFPLEEAVAAARGATRLGATANRMRAAPAA